MAGETSDPKHEVLKTALKLSVAAGLMMACAVQSLVPVVAKVPGLLLCAGGSFELFLRRRDSYGTCGDGNKIHYGIVLVVSLLVWAIIFAPFGVVFARSRARKSP